MRSPFVEDAKVFDKYDNFDNINNVNNSSFESINEFNEEYNTENENEDYYLNPYHNSEIEENFLNLTPIKIASWYKNQAEKKSFFENEPKLNLDQFAFPTWVNIDGIISDFKSKYGNVCDLIVGDKAKISKAQFFVIHDTAGTTNYDISKTKDKGIHLWINSNGTVVQARDWHQNGLGVKLEKKRNNTFVHIELVRDKSLQDKLLANGRLKKKGNEVVNNSKTQDIISNGGIRAYGTLYNDIQYNHLAFAYIIASYRSGKLLSTTIHREVDRNVVIKKTDSSYSYGHNDPVAFDINYFYQLVGKFLLLNKNCTFGIQENRVLALNQENLSNFRNEFIPFVAGDVVRPNQYGNLINLGSSPKSKYKLIKLKYGYNYDVTQLKNKLIINEYLDGISNEIFDENYHSESEFQYKEDHLTNNKNENDEFFENEEEFDLNNEEFESEEEYEIEYEDHESYEENLIKDISKVVSDNRYYKNKLGWVQYFDQINRILLPYAGLSNISLGESDFALALSKWQASQGFAPNEADGVLGPHTWNKLKTQLNIKTSTGFGPLVNSSVSPVNDPVISSEFSNQRKHPVTGKLVAHYGIDIVDRARSKTLGKAVVSATDGTIASVKPKSDGNGAGNRIHIIDNAGYKHSYFHLSDNNFGSNIRAGAPVSMGQKIGEIGNTGRSSGPHLHYETVHPNGTKMNPRVINAGLRMAPNTHEVREFEYEYEFEYS
ncbi:MAG TPA: peptidoglycan DD-metalloendopeptidase family protein [Saprospiraceae bacterium]|jgi:murein DD-endopeptidase MepM/ murein hydrolase activator NlpD|nr:peptidoglycan DD-metalloendopeptidase family protein [Saprospiraceae bacterium]HMT71032.1 peptidoglycan DD-metalloendopeptidase family protein [Saprospiraceae bacterium]